MLRVSLSLLLLICAGSPAHGEVEEGSVTKIESLMRSQQYDAALETSRVALSRTPRDYRVWTLQGIIFGIQGSEPQAAAAFEKALSLAPTYTPALKGEVQLLYQAHDQRVIPLLNKLLKADPKDATAREMLATSEAREGKCQPAIDNFAALGQVIETHPESLKEYGRCLVVMKQSDKATGIFRLLVSVSPNEVYPRYDLAVLLVHAKQYQSALQALDPLLTAEHPDPDVLSLASEAYEALGDTPHAVPLIREAIVLSPNTPEYYVAFASLCLEHESFQPGIDMLNAGIERIPDNPKLFTSRGLLYAQLAKYDKAEDDFRTAEKLDPKQGVSAYAIDLAELQKSPTGTKAPAIREQIKKHPRDAVFYFLLAKVLMDDGAVPGQARFEEALHSVQQALKLRPDMVDARDLLARIYISSGRNDLAIEQCHVALRDSPSDQAALYHLILALRSTGHTDEIQTLSKQLSDLKQQARQKEADTKRYRLVEQEAPHP
jgi:tetratricopeptide (TPR) repeat protein